MVRISVLRANSAELLTDRLSLQDLEVTERGRQLLIEDQLPSHPQCNDEVYYYDPIADRLLSPLEAKLAREEPPAASIDAEAFRELLPEALIRADVARVAPPWWSSASRIDRIERAAVTSVLWRETTAGIECIDGEIRIRTKDPSQAQYISGLPSGEIFRRILATALVDPSAAAEKWRALPAFDLASVAKSDAGWMPIRQAVQALPAQASVCLVDQSAQITSMPDHADPGQVIISFDESLSSGELTLTWNETGDGCLVRVGNLNADRLG